MDRDPLWSIPLIDATSPVAKRVLVSRDFNLSAILAFYVFKTKHKVDSVSVPDVVSGCLKHYEVRYPSVRKEGFAYQQTSRASV